MATSRRIAVGIVAGLALLAIVALAWWLGARRTDARDARAEAAAESGPALYRCPMHPAIVSDQPGECPICFMDLVPIARGERTELDGEGVPGFSTVRLSPRKQQLIGVKTTTVAVAPFRRTIHAAGRVVWDETRLRHVHTKIDGWVEVLHANATGEVVRAGEPLLEIYSPDLLATQQEYLVALATRERTAGSDLPAVAGVGDDLVASVRRRLELWDVTEAQIRELERTGQARRTTTIHAPIGGTIVQRLVTQGERIEAGTSLLEIADLARVWVVASIYEHDLPFVREGQPATVTLSYLPGRTFEGRVALVYPAIDPTSRAVEVRIELGNPDLALRPDMYAEVALEADLGDRLSVPDTAVMETGLRSIAFVDAGNGFFEPREVRVGLRLPDRWEIESGVVAGERVVTSANFFVDAESRLESALAAATGSQIAPPKPPEPPPDPADHRHP